MFAPLSINCYDKIIIDSARFPRETAHICYFMDHLELARKLSSSAF